jgi:DegV family protein with EDD domain
MKLAIITDSGANLDADYIRNHKELRVLPLMIVVGEKSFRDAVEITPSEVYAKLDIEKVSTSLPSLSDLEKLLDGLKNDGYTDVLSISISSGLSGTFNALSLFYRDYNGLNITEFDTKTLAGAQGLLVRRAVELANAGQDATTIVSALEQLRYQDSVAFYTLNTLKYLRRGGRIGKVEGTIGDILHIKPVITVSDQGVYVTAAKSFGFNRALIYIRNAIKVKFKEAVINLEVHYGTSLDEAKALLEKLKQELNVKDFILSQLTPVLGIHTGPSMIAVVASLS